MESTMIENAPQAEIVEENFTLAELSVVELACVGGGMANVAFM